MTFLYSLGPRTRRIKRDPSKDDKRPRTAFSNEQLNRWRWHSTFFFSWPDNGNFIFKIETRIWIKQIFNRGEEGGTFSGVGAGGEPDQDLVSEQESKTEKVSRREGRTCPDVGGPGSVQSLHSSHGGGGYFFLNT